MVSIPGYLKKDDPSLMVDIYWPVPTAYTVRRLPLLDLSR